MPIKVGAFSHTKYGTYLIVNIDKFKDAIKINGVVLNNDKGEYVILKLRKYNIKNRFGNVEVVIKDKNLRDMQEDKEIEINENDYIKQKNKNLLEDIFKQV